MVQSETNQKRDQTKDSGSERRWRESRGHKVLRSRINVDQLCTTQFNAGFRLKRNRYLYLTWVCREHPPWRCVLLQTLLARDPFRLPEHRRFLARLSLFLRIQPRLEVVGMVSTAGCAVVVVMVVVCRRCGGDVGTWWGSWVAIKLKFY